MLGSIISKFDAEAKSHMERQSLNPFSGNFSRSPSPRLSKDQYGRPLAGSKTEERGQKAKCHILREILDLCSCIHDLGVYNKTHRPRDDSDDEGLMDDEIIVSFGEIFQMYTKINDKVVGLLIAAKKRGYLYFEKEILFQRRDDDVLIALIKPIAEIRAIINKEVAANSSPVPFYSREVSPAVGENSDKESPKVSPEKDQTVKPAVESLSLEKPNEVKCVEQNTNTTPDLKPVTSETVSEPSETAKDDPNTIINGEHNEGISSIEVKIEEPNEEVQSAENTTESKHESVDKEQRIPRLEITFEPESPEVNKETVDTTLDEHKSEVPTIDITIDHTSPENNSFSTEHSEIDIKCSQQPSPVTDHEEMKEDVLLISEPPIIPGESAEVLLSVDDTGELDDKENELVTTTPTNPDTPVIELTSNEALNAESNEIEQSTNEQAESPAERLSLNSTDNIQNIENRSEVDPNNDRPNIPDEISHQYPVGEHIDALIENERAFSETMKSVSDPVSESLISQIIDDVNQINLDNVSNENRMNDQIISNGVESQSDALEEVGLVDTLDDTEVQRIKINEYLSTNDSCSTEKAPLMTDEGSLFQNQIENLAITLPDRSPSPDPCDEEVQQILESHISSVAQTIDSTFQEERFHNDQDRSG